MIKFEERELIRLEAKKQILNVQEENRRNYNLRRRKPNNYSLGQLVAIKRTQMTPSRKLRCKFLGPYEIIKVKANHTYDVTRIGDSEGALNTSTCAEYIKPWL